MQDLKERVDKVRRELDELTVALAARAKSNDYMQGFKKKEACENAMLGVSKANSELFYAQMALS